jgi:hypothetical protein
MLQIRFGHSIGADRRGVDGCENTDSGEVAALPPNDSESKRRGERHPRHVYAPAFPCSDWYKNGGLTVLKDRFRMTREEILKSFVN